MTTDLLKRLESGETGREMDLAIGTIWPDPSFSLSIEQQRGGKPPVPEFTTDLNAAVVAVERNEDVLTWEASNTPAGPFGRIVTTRADYKGVGATPAAALIAALLKAKGAGDE